jgi:hypothetical protein
MSCNRECRGSSVAVVVVLPKRNEIAMSPATARPLTAPSPRGATRAPTRLAVRPPTLAALFVALLVVGVLIAAALTDSSSPPQRAGSPAATSQFGGRLAVSGPAAADSAARPPLH